MNNNKLHIVSYDVPYPPDYGGAIDLFYKVKSLHEAGCEIYLHCYEYGRARATELEQYAKEVHYYTRDTGIKNLSLFTPYIIVSRRNKSLLKRLQEIEAPILFEGVQTSFFLNDPLLAKRFKAIRTHNIEYKYYQQLVKKEPAFFTRSYYKMEAVLLKKYESALHNADAFLPLSMADSEHLKELYPETENDFIPPFHPYDRVDSLTGSGDYCIYHGNLSHPENREAAFFLMKEVIPKVSASFIIAGKAPGADLISAAEQLPNCKIIADPEQRVMDELVANAHIHVLPTFQQSGMKLKLLAALFGGRHVLVNDAMLYGTGLGIACTIAYTAVDFTDHINTLMQQPFTAAHKQQRATQLVRYDKASNARELMAIMMKGADH